jgi:hypothetical protein
MRGADDANGMDGATDADAADGADGACTEGARANVAELATVAFSDIDAGFTGAGPSCIENGPAHDTARQDRVTAKSV